MVLNFKGIKSLILIKTFLLQNYLKFKLKYKISLIILNKFKVLYISSFIPIIMSSTVNNI